MSIDLTKLASSVKAKRERDGISLRGLSKIAGVGAATLSRIENCQLVPNQKTALPLIDWLGASPEEYGIEREVLVHVHFRAAKNAGSKVVSALVEVAECVAAQNGSMAIIPVYEEKSLEKEEPPSPTTLSKSQMEGYASSLRKELKHSDMQPFDALKLRIDGVKVETVSELGCVKENTREMLSGVYSDEWSAMTVPVKAKDLKWVVVRNDLHSLERQRVTYLEEAWHILMGHRLTKVVKLFGIYSRDYEATEEHDAYYLAAATLIPQKSIIKLVDDKKNAAQIADHFGVSQALVEYRIKRLGLWRKYTSLGVSLD